MRDRAAWYGKTVKDLSHVWPADLTVIRPSVLCQVELGLRLLERLAPDQPAEGAWSLLGGYPFARAMGIITDAADEQLLSCARHLLWTMRRRRTWHQSLEAYRQVPEHLRGYRLPLDGGPARRLEPTAAGDRFSTYDNALENLPAFALRPLTLAGPGSHRFTDRRRRTSVTIPEQLCPPTTIAGHDLMTASASNGGPLDIPLAELADTAQWMDETERQLGGRSQGDWAQRLSDLQLDRRTDDGTRFKEAKVLHLDRLLHLVGMVGAGKSTLMIIIAVWAARRRLRTTLVVGDVAEQLTLVTLFRELLGQDAAAPVLGSTTRERNVQRLHRRLAAKGLPSLLHHDDPGFDDLSTACAIDALRGAEAAEPLRYADAPCSDLHATPAPPTVTAVDSDAIELPGRYRDRNRDRSRPSHLGEDDDQGPALGCPLWYACPRHSAAQALVDAWIWVANPASLVQSPVPHHLNDERLRHLELACLRSDIIVVDEVDRVQMNLDEMFAPSATLVLKGPESWLDHLHTHKIAELAREGRLQLSEPDVARWTVSLSIVSSATNRLYEMLISDPELRKWSEIEYFSAWTLQEKLLSDWYPTLESLAKRAAGLPDATADETDAYEDEGDTDTDNPTGPQAAPWTQRRNEVTRILDVFRDDPLGDNTPYGSDTDLLVAVTHDLLHTLNERGTRTRVRAVLDRLLADSPAARGELPPPKAPRGQCEPNPADVHGSEPWYERTTRRLEFTLLLAALHQRLDRLTFLWPRVEAALHLDSTGNELSRRPPLDYAPIVPEAPMGNVLGFQYLPDEDGEDRDPDGRCSGTLRFFRCAGVGRELLLSLPDLGSDPANGRSGPHVILMSGTSWAGTSTRSHVLAPVGAVLKPNSKALKAIRRTVFTTLFLYDDEGQPISLSGQDLDVRPAMLRLMVTRLGKRSRGLPSLLEQELSRIDDEDRRRALLLVANYREAAIAADRLEGIDRWRGRVRLLVADDAELHQAIRGDGAEADRPQRASTIRRGDLASFADDKEAELLVAPLMAIERGHNILNSQRKAAFGTVLFLARPHPRPDDLSLSILAISDWASRFVRNMPREHLGSEPNRYRTFDELATKAGDLDKAGLAFRHAAREEWRRLLSRRYMYSRLSPAEKTSFAWDQLVTIWQVIGRLVRGGVPARVVFVDAKFAPRTAAAQAPAATPEAKARQDTPASSLLAGLRAVLAPYLSDDPDPADFTDPADPELAKLLYQPLYDALCGLTASPVH
ncbi:hypothetical protein [Frankia sp. Cj3]|uniref:pPIWI_RE_Z domain-containing protein n=1 Tax=Frankia sp. Cj3 TaxID=2880976 RepID=UPI001EF42EDF|nr:hypothetical protein [Frankia sp. Cj3]